MYRIIGTNANLEDTIEKEGKAFRMDENLKVFSVRFRTLEKVTIFHQLKACSLEEAIEQAKKLGEEKGWRMVSIREFSAKKSEKQREPKISLQTLEKARVIGFTDLDYEKEMSKISIEEKRLYQTKIEAWNQYKTLCTKFYSEYSEDLEKQLQEARRKFDLALRNFNHYVNESYDKKIDVVL